jgi:hypothetical protein
VDARQRRRELLRKRRTGRRVLGVAQQAARERLAGDEVHHEEGRPEDGGIVLAEADRRHGHASGAGRTEDLELLAAAPLERAPGRVAAEHQVLGPAVGVHEVEGPALARRAAGERAQRRDARRTLAGSSHDPAGELLRERGHRSGRCAGQRQGRVTLPWRGARHAASAGVPARGDGGDGGARVAPLRGGCGTHARLPSSRGHG